MTAERHLRLAPPPEDEPEREEPFPIVFFSCTGLALLAAVAALLEIIVRG